MKTMKLMLLTATFVFAATGAFAYELGKNDPNRDGHMATIQIIHNSPDPAAASVDIYVNGGAMPAIEDLDFRAATGLVELPADVDLEVGIAPGSSMGPEDIIATWTFNLPAGSQTVVMASGVLGSDFDLFTNELLIGAKTDVAILAFHGAPDAPAVDVGAEGVGTLITNLMYQTFQGYLSVPAADYTLTIAPTGGEPIAAFIAPLSGVGGNSLVVFASGYLGEDPGFGLFAALNDGTVLELTPDNSVATEEVSLDDVKAMFR